MKISTKMFRKSVNDGEVNDDDYKSQDQDVLGEEQEEEE